MHGAIAEDARAESNAWSSCREGQSLPPRRQGMRGFNRYPGYTPSPRPSPGVYTRRERGQLNAQRLRIT